MKENFLEILGLAVFGALAYLLTPVKKWASKTINRLFKRDHAFGPEHADREKRINERCVELRMIMNADRVNVCKFHNGEMFSARDPLFKITCTNETCRAGIAYTIQSVRALLVSSVIELLRPLFGPVKAPGIGAIDKHMCPCEKPCELPRTVCSYEIDAMEECSTKAILLEHGVTFKLVAPLIDRRDRVFGYIGVDYCSSIDSGEAIKMAPTVCSAANMISHLIQSDDPVKDSLPERKE